MTCGNPGKCDRITGHCYGGCQPGWIGLFCKKGNWFFSDDFTHIEKKYTKIHISLKKVLILGLFFIKYFKHYLDFTY